MNAFTRIDTPENLDNLIAYVASHVPYQLPLFRAVRAGTINLIMPTRGGTIQKALLRATGRPTAVLIGDDDYQSSGPEGWACARRVKAWCAASLVHAAAGELQHYETAVVATLAYQRLVLIETDSAHREAWANFMAPRPILTIRTGDGLPHPIQPPKDQMQ